MGSTLTISSYLQFHVGRQLLDHVSPRSSLGGDEGLDGGAEVGPGAETRKSLVDKHLCSRDGRHYAQHPSRTPQSTLREEFQNENMFVDKRENTPTQRHKSN